MRDLKMTDFPTYPWETPLTYIKKTVTVTISVLANMSLEIYSTVPGRSWYHTTENHMCR